MNPGYGYGGYGEGPRGGYTSDREYAPDNVSVGEPSPYYVESMPPEPLYEQMTASPGDSSVWIDGYWHWNGYEWVWVGGRWEREQAGYVYVEPNYDYVADQFVYTPGYWSQPQRVPRGWIVRDHRDGRPTVVAPPAGGGGYRPPAGGGGFRPPVDGGGRPVRPPPIASPGGNGNGIKQPPAGGTIRPTRVPVRAGGDGTVYHPPPDVHPIGSTAPPEGGVSTGGGSAIGAGGIARPPVQPSAEQPGFQPGRPVQSQGGYRQPGQPPPRPSQVQPPGGSYHPAGPVYVRPSGPAQPTQPPGGAYQPPPRGPTYVRPAQPPAAGGPIYVRPAAPSQPPSAPPAAGGPIYVRPNAPSQPPAGGPIYVRPAQPGGALRPPPPSAPPPAAAPAPTGGPVYVRPTGPSQPAPAAQPAAPPPQPVRNTPAQAPVRDNRGRR